jgi:SAM-dependent methyltransferase
MITLVVDEPVRCKRFANSALDLAQVRSGSEVVDVATGPGTLAFLAAARGAQVSALDFSAEMLSALQQRIRQTGEARVRVLQGDGQALPYAEASFDAGFSMFGLMFFPDRPRGFRELARVLRPRSPAVVASWTNMERVPLMSALFSTLMELVPGPAKPTPPVALPLVDPEMCVREMSEGGFTDVVVHEVVGEVQIASTRELVEFFSRTNAPVVLRKRALGEAWGPVQEQLIARLEKAFGAGPQQLLSPANLTFGLRA